MAPAESSRVEKNSHDSCTFQDVAGVIFDLDGTLADTLEDIAAGVNHALAAEGLPAVAAEQVRGWVGDGYVALMKRAAPQADEAQLQRLIGVGGSYYGKHALDRTRLYPGVQDVLETLRTRGLRVAVLSNKPEPITIETIRALCPEIEFDAVAGYRDESSKKPNPALALDIAGRMGLPPRRVIFVGDSATDTATAHNAGMRAVSATWGFRSREQLLAAGPDAMIDRPAELLELLELSE
jgi:phosphoglycolate phosphatase